MPLFFLQKQELGASGSAHRGPARAIGRGGVRGGSQIGNITTESRISLLIRCRLHIHEYSMQLLIVAAKRNYAFDTLSSA